MYYVIEKVINISRSSMKASSDFKYKKKIHADWCDISLNKQILNSASPQPLFLQFLIELLKGLGVKKKNK